MFPLPAWSGSVAPAGTGRRWRSSLPVPRDTGPEPQPQPVTTPADTTERAPTRHECDRESRVPLPHRGSGSDAIPRDRRRALRSRGVAWIRFPSYASLRCRRAPRRRADPAPELRLFAVLPRSCAVAWIRFRSHASLRCRRVLRSRGVAWIRFRSHASLRCRRVLRSCAVARIRLRSHAPLGYRRDPRSPRRAAPVPKPFPRRRPTGPRLGRRECDRRECDRESRVPPSVPRGVGLRIHFPRRQQPRPAVRDARRPARGAAGIACSFLRRAGPAPMRSGKRSASGVLAGSEVCPREQRCWATLGAGK